MLTGFMLNHGFGAFNSGWMQFAAAFGVSFMIMICFGRKFVNAMRRIQGKGQPISENLPKTHLEKNGTPTMGGLLILAAVFVGSLLFVDWTNASAISAGIALSSLAMFGAIGFADDYKKVLSQSKKASNGLSPIMRLALEGLCVIVLAFMINWVMPPYIPGFSVTLPFGIILPLGIFYYVFAYFVIAGGANATNITDGLDGMLSKLYLPVLAVLVVALYGATRIGFMDTVIFLPNAGSLYPVLGAVFGAMLGFLWFNSRPASIFMGDVGSLALGGFMGTAAMLLKSEIIMGVAAGMMVLILLSSFSQTMYFKITKKIYGQGRRIFKRAPLHHHFEEKGWAETKIVERFFIIGILCAGLALVMLKFA
ncbi:MAG: phospho-N-acetylmuramoyl-pentapeptide-transferase [Rickettsiales bacterium]|jgi:phospho-N-acetylmuramoyl-pentapeptide-transferase|nr:phospho-N-acetylmuramoyl-pentapeptide-transferase [Rickettsiales bacterium]